MKLSACYINRNTNVSYLSRYNQECCLEILKQFQYVAQDGDCLEGGAITGISFKI